MTDQPEREGSSLELLLQGILKPVEEVRAPLRAGMICPACREGRLDYNGLLALECPKCGYTKQRRRRVHLIIKLLAPLGQQWRIYGSTTQ